jgi:hypothetical protein
MYSDKARALGVVHIQTWRAFGNILLRHHRVLNQKLNFEPVAVKARIHHGAIEKQRQLSHLR